MESTPTSRTMHTASHKRTFRFRWWMAVILVVIIAAIGIVVLRFSRASVIPPEELQKIQANITVSNPGITGVTVSYQPYGYTRQFSLAEALRAQQDPAEYDKLMALVIADLEKIYIKNHPNATATTTETTSTGQTANTPSATAPVLSGDATTTTTTTSPESSSTTSTASSSDAQSQSTPKDLGTISGLETLHFTPTNPEGIKSVSLIVNNTLIQVVKQSPYTFSFDTRQFPNATYPLKIVVTNTDNTIEQVYYTAKIQNSSISRLFYSFGGPIRFLLGL